MPKRLIISFLRYPSLKSCMAFCSLLSLWKLLMGQLSPFALLDRVFCNRLDGIGQLVRGIAGNGCVFARYVRGPDNALHNRPTHLLRQDAAFLVGCLPRLLILPRNAPIEMALFGIFGAFVKEAIKHYCFSQVMTLA